MSREMALVGEACGVAAAPVDELDFVGIGVHGPRKAVDKVVNGLKFLA
jgi:hypothetical protein